MTLDSHLSHARKAAHFAWSRVAHFYQSDLAVDRKDEGSPVTEADREADKLIVGFLEEHHPRNQYGYLSEEFENDDSRLDKKRVWIIDPIDGTADFIKGRADFAIHIALAVLSPDGLHHPAASLVYQPVPGLMALAIRGEGAWIERERRGPDDQPWWRRDPKGFTSVQYDPAERLAVTKNVKPGSLTAVVSKSHPTRRLEVALENLPIKSFYRRGSLGVKMTEVAMGRADFYINTESRKCKEWDLCAPQLIVEEAGGRVTDLRGVPVSYNRRDVAVEDGVLATNGGCHDVLVENYARLNLL